MKRISSLLLPALALLAACGSSNTKSEADNNEGEAQAASANMAGNWDIVNVVVNDSVCVAPAEIAPEATQQLRFMDDGSFAAVTNCNTINGSYSQRGDSILISPSLITEMACDDMQTEQLLLQVLPLVQTVDCTSDSIVRLNTISSAYIMLKKAE